MGDKDGILSVWDVKTWRQLFTFELDGGRLRAMHYIENDDLLLVGKYNGEISVVKGLGIKLEKTVKFYIASEKIEQIEKLNTESELNFTQVDRLNNISPSKHTRKDDIRDTKEFRK